MAALDPLDMEQSLTLKEIKLTIKRQNLFTSKVYNDAPSSMQIRCRDLKV